MWQEITLWQYQQIIPIMTKPDKDWTEIDVDYKLISILTGMTQYQIDSLPLEDLKKERAKLKFLKEDITGKPVKYIEVNGRRYRVIYNVKDMPFARYIESKVFGKDVVGNLHKISASMVMPQKRNWLGRWVDNVYDASKHEQYSLDMQEAKFVDVYHTLVFFYQVYRNWIEVSKDYMTEEMVRMGMTQEEADSVVILLYASMDGNIPQGLLPSRKISALKQYLK
jgi:hypothetical protein